MTQKNTNSPVDPPPGFDAAPPVGGWSPGQRVDDGHRGNPAIVAVAADLLRRNPEATDKQVAAWIWKNIHEPGDWQSMPGHDPIEKKEVTDLVRAATGNPFVRPVDGIHPPVDDDPPPSTTPIAYLANVDPNPRPEHDNSIWTASAELSTLRAWANYQMVSPWALLAAVLVRVAAEDAWTHHIPGPRGDKIGAGTSALYAVLVGAPAQGKSSAKRALNAALRVINGNLCEANRWTTLKTSEGALRLFIDEQRRPKKADDPLGDPDDQKWRQTRWNALAWMDELQAGIKIAGRKGNWLPESLSSNFTGHWDGRTTLTDPMPAPAQNTHLSLLAGGQDPTVAKLVAETEHQGWSKRLLVVDTIDPHYPDDIPAEPPAQLEIEIPDCGRCDICAGTDDGQTYIYSEPAEIRNEIIDDRRQVLLGKKLGSHNLLIQRRVAKQLAILHGRQAVLIDDWNIARSVIDHSDKLRAHLDDQLPDHLRAANRTRDTAAVIADQQRKKHPDRVAHIMASVHVKLLTEHPDGMTMTDINRALGGRWQGVLKLNATELSPSHQVLDRLHSDGLVRWDGSDDGQPPTTGTIIEWK